MILYTTYGCPNCDILKNIMNSKRIDYTIESVQKLLDDGVNVRQAPVLEYDGKHLNFNESLELLRSIN